jgi:hypothetical protein
MSMLSFDDIVNYFGLNSQLLKIKDCKTNYINPYNISNPSDYKLIPGGDSDISIDILKQKTKQLKEQAEVKEIPVVEPVKKQNDNILETLLYQFNTNKNPESAKLMLDIPLFLRKYYPDNDKYFANFKIQKFEKNSFAKNKYNIMSGLWKFCYICPVPLGIILETATDKTYIMREKKENMVWIYMKLGESSFELVIKNDENIVYMDDLDNFRKQWNISNKLAIGSVNGDISGNTFSIGDISKMKSAELLELCKQWKILDLIKEKSDKIKKDDLIRTIYEGF